MPCHKLIINNITLTIKLTAICCILLIYRAGCGAVQYRQLSRRSVACVFYDMHVCKCAWCVEETASAEWSERERERERERAIYTPCICHAATPTARFWRTCSTRRLLNYKLTGSSFAFLLSIDHTEESECVFFKFVNQSVSRSIKTDWYSITRRNRITGVPHTIL